MLKNYLKNRQKGTLKRTEGFNFPDGYEKVTANFYTVGDDNEVFAFIGKPKSPKPQGGYPAVVLVHGGDGMAYFEWVNKWTERGYVAIAPDFNGCFAKCVDKRREENVLGGHKGYGSFRNFNTDNPWTFFSVKSIMSAVDVLCDMPEVNASKIAISGLSWGGVLSLITLSFERRIKVASIFYATGNLLDDDFFNNSAKAVEMTDEQRQMYFTHFDPVSYVSKINVPILFVAGADDHAFTMSCRKKTTDLIKSKKYFSYRKSFPHSHTAGRNCVEAMEFTDRILKNVAQKEINLNVHNQSIFIENFNDFYGLEIIGTEREFERLKGEWESEKISSNHVNLPSNFKYFFVSGKDENGLNYSTDIFKI